MLGEMSGTDLERDTGGFDGDELLARLCALPMQVGRVELGRASPWYGSLDEFFAGVAASRQATTAERRRIRRELLAWLVGDLGPQDAGIVAGRRVVDEIDRICPE